MPEPEQSKVDTQNQPNAQQVTQPDQTAGERRFTQAEVENILKERLDREKSKREEAEKKARETAEKDALAKNSEWEKLAKKAQDELDTVKRELAQKTLEAKRRGIAEKIGLPAQLAERLRGETDEEIEEDAKSLLAALPKPPKTPSMNPTNPGGAQQGETIEQQRARIWGAASNPFDSATAKAKGGGVFFVDKTEK